MADPHRRRIQIFHLAVEKPERISRAPTQPPYTTPRGLCDFRRPLVLLQSESAALSDRIYTGIIGVFLFNVESMIFFFWTWILMCSTSNIMFPGLLSGRYHYVTKWLALTLPVLQTAIINIPVVMATTIPQIILYNLFLVVPVFTGSICLIIILYNFSRARWNASWSHSAWSKKLRVWQLWDRGQQANFNASHSDPSQVFSQTSIPASGAHAIAQNRRKEEDRYLLLRFCVCFIIVSLFQLSFIFSQVVNSRAAYARMQPDAEKPIYGWTKSQQLTDWAFFIAGSSIGYFISLLFGTTQECRRVHRQQIQRFRTWREKRRTRRQEEALLDVEVMKFEQPAVFAVPAAQRFGAQRSITLEALKRPEKVRGGYRGEELGETWSPLYHPGGYGSRGRGYENGGRAPQRNTTVRSQNIITITGGDVV